MANESFGKAGEHLEWPANSSFIQNQSSESCFWQMTAAFRLKKNLAIWPKRFTTLAVTPVRTIEATPDKSRYRKLRALVRILLGRRPPCNHIVAVGVDMREHSRRS